MALSCFAVVARFLGTSRNGHSRRPASPHRQRFLKKLRSKPTSIFLPLPPRSLRFAILPEALTFYRLHADNLFQTPGDDEYKMRHIRKVARLC